MKTASLLFTLALASVLATVPAQAAAARYRAGIYVGPAFGPWGWYGPAYGPYYGGYPVFSHPNAGQLRIDTKVKEAQVFINGAYAGTAKEMKSTWLKQGDYQVEVRMPTGEKFDTRIYVSNGKTIHVRPEFSGNSNS
jgi:hypothetical protein